jgi:N-carbamoyl-L-amino-acid hydrolase
MAEQDLFQQIPNTVRLESDINTLASYTDPDQPWTRRPFTKLFQEGREWLSREMEAAGLTVELDASGNVVGRRPGTENLPPILIGSHTDTVSGGGRFDGAIGVIAGLEIARCLGELEIQLRHPLEIVDFLGEEPTDFGVSTVGSRGMTNNLTPEMLAKTDDSGRTLEEALVELGGRPADIPAEVRGPGDIAAYLEIHIEQGPVLEQRGIPLAAVTGIAGIRRFFVVVSGEINHAGTTPMDLRKDGLIAAAQFVVDAERIIRQEKNAVGTVGYLSVSPNMANVVPGRVELIVEMRSIEPEIIERIGQNLKKRAAQIAEARQIPISVEPLTDAHPVQADPRLIEITTEACREVTPDALVLPSGAGHDATQIATIAPIGMIFVPSRDGKSHCPEEWTDLEDIALGVQALARTLVKVDKAF